MKNILIVEDDPMVAMINEEYLSTIENIKVIGRTCNEKETLKFLETNKVDLIVLDIFLGNENGLEILKKIRFLNYTTDVIMITSANGGDDIKTALSLGCIDYLIKPFDFDRLKLSIERFFTRSEILNKSKIIQKSIDDIHLKSSSCNNHSHKINLPKGLNCKTLEKINNIISSLPYDEFGIKEICEKSEISNVTIKKYLDYLESIKVITSFSSYGNIGRPLYLYKKIKSLESKG